MTDGKMNDPQQLEKLQRAKGKRKPLINEAHTANASDGKGRDDMSSQFTYAPDEPRFWTTEICGGDVRWSNATGKLQQRFVITEYFGSSPAGSRQVWRDVPFVDDGPVPYPANCEAPHDK